MPKKLRIIVITLLLLIPTGFTYLLLSGDNNYIKNSKTTEQKNPASLKQENEQTIQTGTYADYSADVVASTKGQRILFFHAPWCPQCRQLEASIKVGTIPSDVTIFKVDYDSSQKLRQQYGVTIQTTLVLLDDKGNGAKKYVAYDQPSLDAIVKNLL